MNEPDAKDRLYLSLRAGARISAAQLDRALQYRFTDTDPRDPLLVAHWLAAEVAAAGQEGWWANEREGAPLRAVHLISERYTAGWGGRADYPLSTWTFDFMAQRWAVVYESCLDDLVLPVLENPGPLHAQRIAEQARSEAQLRIVALCAVAVPAELCEQGNPAPIVSLLGDLYAEPRRKRSRRSDRCLSPLDVYAALAAWQRWSDGSAGADRFARALLRARHAGSDPYLAVCEQVTSERWHVDVQELGMRRFAVRILQHGTAGASHTQEFSTEQASLSDAVAWTDELRAACREHNRELAGALHAELTAQMLPFAQALSARSRESAAALAARQAGALTPGLDASAAVQMLKARLP